MLDGSIRHMAYDVSSLIHCVGGIIPVLVNLPSAVYVLYINF